jgi:hypothetical protein
MIHLSRLARWPPQLHRSLNLTAAEISCASDEAAIFPRELAIRVMLASLVSQPRRSFSEGADLIVGGLPV